jgi:erythromycin esterase-like protein
MTGSLTAGPGVSVAAIATRAPAMALVPPAFLAKNSQPLNLADPGRFDAGPLDLIGKRVFLLGEEHNVAINNDLDLALVRYLHKAAAVRVYLAELSYAEGCLINRYFETGERHSK